MHVHDASSLRCGIIKRCLPLNCHNVFTEPRIVYTFDALFNHGSDASSCTAASLPPEMTHMLPVVSTRKASWWRNDRSLGPRPQESQWQLSTLQASQCACCRQHWPRQLRARGQYAKAACGSRWRPGRRSRSAQYWQRASPAAAAAIRGQLQRPRRQTLLQTLTQQGQNAVAMPISYLMRCAVNKTPCNMCRSASRALLHPHHQAVTRL